MDLALDSAGEGGIEINAATVEHEAQLEEYETERKIELGESEDRSETGESEGGNNTKATNEGELLEYHLDT